jgi:hypothetical protein
MSPCLKRQKFVDVISKESLKRTSTMKEPHNPVTFLKHYFQKLVYEEFKLEEKDDCLSIGENKLRKPFVEKPFDA